MTIRMGEPADVPAMLAIYAQYIDTTITFETEVPTEEDFRGRLDGILREHPWIVSEEEGRVCAYAYAYRLKDRAAYAWSAGPKARDRRWPLRPCCLRVER